MSVELGKLGLEIGHEKSDALHDWARDKNIGIGNNYVNIEL
jgi:hypothetical protein